MYQAMGILVFLAMAEQVQHLALRVQVCFVLAVVADSLIIFLVEDVEQVVLVVVVVVVHGNKMEIPALQTLAAVVVAVTSAITRMGHFPPEVMVDLGW
jgi:hypothetical protein